MLRLQNISLVQFRNYSFNQFEFSKKITAFCGKNGIGKTNLLDAVYLLCFTKSYFGKTDAQNVTYGHQGYRIEGSFNLNQASVNVHGILRPSGKKEFACNNETYQRLTSHIGKFPCVMIAPDDVAIITSGSEERRRFIDYTLGQTDTAYLQHLIQYNKTLQQRNSLLKQFAETGRRDLDLLDVIDAQLVSAGHPVFSKRSDFIATFVPLVLKVYSEICSAGEMITMQYESPLQQSAFSELLKTNRIKDLNSQRTTTGVHRDEISLTMQNQSFKQVASQGQRKSLLFALKLAEFEFLQQQKGFAPLLLLDDVFEKLDEERMKNLLIKVCTEYDGQVFISDTHKDRLQQSLEFVGLPFEIKMIN